MAVSLRSRPSDVPECIGDTVGLDHARAIADAHTPASILDHADTCGILRAAISGLEPAHQHVLALRHDHDLSFEEIGREMGISKPAAFKLHERAVARLRISLELMGVGTRLAFA